ncbi:MAG: SEC-C metal-binding domain-containing protein [Solirubrobacteraceae bacterium]|nr:SEC-C metal-binding domain-containing protein [Solirubrobacteraceae bacterium]
MNAGRNDPCPCGSGVKFKRCCNDAQQAERQAERERARLADAQSVTVYHGTCESRLTAIRRDGLRGQNGVGPFVTDDENRAAGYAVRATCVELHSRGLTDVRRARRAVVLTLRVDRSALIADPAHAGDALLAGGCTWEHVRDSFAFAPAGHVSDSEVMGYAARAALAQGVESSWQDTRLGSSQ